MSHFKSSIGEKLRSLFSQVDGASCVFFRVAFGLLMAKWAWDYLELGRVRKLYIEPTYHFSYYGFDWVQPWPGEWMLVHFLALMVLALMIAAGCFYRLACVLFALGFTYFFLLDRTNYQNHYYLLGLIAWWLPWMPLHRNVSVDAWRRPELRSQTVPRWTLWMLRFHVGLPYFFGGIAKLVPDWLLGEPLGQMLAAQASLPLLGPWLATPGAGLMLAWGGLLFDLLIVPLLMWKPSRALAYCLCIVFHLMNAVIFNIHVFPWFMLAATPIFFEADWPRRVLGGSRLSSADLGQASDARLTIPAMTTWRKLAVSLMLVYVTFHCVWPLRHQFYPGDASWNERGHYFAWRMMLRGKVVVLGYALKNQVTGETVDGHVNRFINDEQSEKFGRDPEMILQFAHFLGEEYRRVTGQPASVYVLALASLNGRKPELLIDPNVDLMQQPRGFHQRAWVPPQQEPLRRPAWDVPVAQWREHVDIPELKFLTRHDTEPASSENSVAAIAEEP